MRQQDQLNVVYSLLNKIPDENKSGHILCHLESREQDIVLLQEKTQAGFKLLLSLSLSFN